MDFTELREAIEEMELVDAHAHNIVALDSTFPFISGFSEANGDALTFAPHSLSFKVLTLLRRFFFFFFFQAFSKVRTGLG
jgi:cytochrome b subunit of formate dehydrogenase